MTTEDEIAAKYPGSFRLGDPREKEIKEFRRNRDQHSEAMNRISEEFKDIERYTPNEPFNWSFYNRLQTGWKPSFQKLYDLAKNYKENDHALAVNQRGITFLTDCIKGPEALPTGVWQEIRTGFNAFRGLEDRTPIRHERAKAVYDKLFNPDEIKKSQKTENNLFFNEDDLASFSQMNSAQIVDKVFANPKYNFLKDLKIQSLRDRYARCFKIRIKLLKERGDLLIEMLKEFNNRVSAAKDRGTFDKATVRTIVDRWIDDIMKLGGVSSTSRIAVGYRSTEYALGKIAQDIKNAGVDWSNANWDLSPKPDFVVALEQKSAKYKAHVLDGFLRESSKLMMDISQSKYSSINKVKDYINSF